MEIEKEADPSSGWSSEEPLTHLLSQPFDPKTLGKCIHIKPLCCSHYPNLCASNTCLETVATFIYNRLVKREKCPWENLNSLCLDFFIHRMSTTYFAYCENKKEWGNGDLIFIEKQGILFLWQQCSGRKDETHCIFQACHCPRWLRKRNWMNKSMTEEQKAQKPHTIYNYVFKWGEHIQQSHSNW